MSRVSQDNLVAVYYYLYIKCLSVPRKLIQYSWCRSKIYNLVYCLKLGIIWHAFWDIDKTHGLNLCRKFLLNISVEFLKKI